MSNTRARTQGPESERNGPAQELLDRLREEEAGNSHFTYIVLALRDQHVEVRQGGGRGGAGQGNRVLYAITCHVFQIGCVTWNVHPCIIFINEFSRVRFH